MTMTTMAVNALIVIDGGPGTARAIKRAGDLLGDKDGVATLLYLIPHAHLHGLGLPVADEWDDPDAEYARAQGQLEDAIRRLRERGVRVAIEPRTVAGNPREVVTRIAAQMGADVIILGPTLPVSPLEAPRAPTLSAIRTPIAASP